MDIPLWLSIVLYLVAGLAIVGVLYLLVLTAVRHAMRAPLAETRTARRRQEDLLREISTSAAYLADVADAWAEGEAERRAATGAASAGELGAPSGGTETPSPWSAEGAALAKASQPDALQSGAVEPEVPRDAAGQPASEREGLDQESSEATKPANGADPERSEIDGLQHDVDDEPRDEQPGSAVGSSSSGFSA